MRLLTLGLLALLSAAAPAASQTITHGTHNYFTYPSSPVSITYAGARTGFIFTSPATGLNHWQSDWWVTGQVIRIPDLAVRWNTFSYWGFLDNELRGCRNCEAGLYLLDPLSGTVTGANLWNPIGAPIIGEPGQRYWNASEKTTFNLGGLTVASGQEYLFVYGPTAIPTRNNLTNGLNLLTFNPNVAEFESGLGCFTSGTAWWDDAIGPPLVPGLPTCGTDDLLYEATFATVPEPGTLLLVATGLVGLARGRSRRKAA